jgi:hypothetical protein
MERLGDCFEEHNIFAPRRRWVACACDTLAGDA